METRVYDMEATGRAIRDLRKEKNISVEQLQQMLGLASKQAIYAWENAKNRVTIDHLLILAAVFGVTVDELIRTKCVE